MINIERVPIWKKKAVYLFAVLSLALTLCGCGSKKEDSTGVDGKTTTKV